MRWRGRRARATRRPATSADPVAAVLADAAAGGPLVRRFPDVEARLEELPGWIDVEDSGELEGYDTVVRFGDEIASYCDPYDDGLDLALADQPGLDAVLPEDREVVYLRSPLALADVKAAVIRAVLEVNRSPRSPAPSRVLPTEAVEELVATVRPLLEQAGFANTHAGVRYFYREGRDGFVGSIAFASGSGTSADRTSQDGQVWVMSGTHLPGIGRDVPSSPDRVAPVHCHQLVQHWAAPTADDLRRLLVAEVLPVLDLTRDRAGLATWIGEDPTRVGVPDQRPTYARLFAQWGQADQAARVVAHLDRHWRSLRAHPDTAAARELIRAAARR
ncbi:hypothetical protein [Nocardioides mesophilus]|uniref:Uncharacterized protein n=1 Tax=Nocardioides mesophilus TaxID=433659 RepID=A0A7G9RAI1_9ACTN|nr:hypothetical protein [Nocardioides mesophilus]QNN52606.1 hypothetical protein H9L09_19495 [Nocardioides mesophilus]